ncbi:hypothetical protein [Nocardia gipuzkoensis]
MTVESIVRAGTEGREAVRSGLAELERYGYLERCRERRADGTLGATAYCITDVATATSPTPLPARGPEPGSGNPTLAEPTTVHRLKKKIRKEHIKQTVEASSSATVEIETVGARLLRQLRLQKPVSEQVIRQHAARVDRHLRTGWSPTQLGHHLEQQCNHPGVINPMGRLVAAIREIPADPPSDLGPTRSGPCDPTPKDPCGTCGSPHPGGMITVIQAGTEAAAPCPACNLRAHSHTTPQG